MKKKLNFFITLLGFYTWKVRIKLVQTTGVSQFWKQFIEDFKINSHEWPRQNFSLEYQYNIKQTCEENTGRHKLGDYYLI